MKYWQGQMNWPLDSNWSCEICGNVPLMPISSGLTWGLVNGQCRCNKCHTEYFMKNSEGEAVTIPICQLKPKYAKPYKAIWNEARVPIDQVDDELWDKYLISEKIA